MESPHKPQKPTCVCVCVCIALVSISDFQNTVLCDVKDVKRERDRHYLIVNLFYQY